MNVVLVFYECRSPLACFLPGEVLLPQSILLRQIAIHLARYGPLRSGQSVVVWPGVIAPKENGIYLSIPALPAAMIEILLVGTGQESLEIQKKKIDCLVVVFMVELYHNHHDYLSFFQ